ncbi:hypothetical protein FHG87_009169 [Trinorchestia longiramus]|nr:hypothetical protein FHG87_009169 [Trinorchestia longiramus]
MSAAGFEPGSSRLQADSLTSRPSWSEKHKQDHQVAIWKIRPTVSIPGGLLSSMAKNNRDCKATSILITRNNWISEKGQKISLDNETTASFADVKELYESKKGSILTTTTLIQFAVNPSNLLSTPQRKLTEECSPSSDLCQEGRVG